MKDVLFKAESTSAPLSFDVPAESASSCPAGPRRLDLSHLIRVRLDPSPPLPEYRAAMRLANQEAQALLGEFMLLSWYDRDRDFESPQHASECHEDSAIPGYVDYGVNHGATLEVDIEQGRFVFFYLPVDLSTN